MKRIIIALGFLILMIGSASGYVSQNTQIPNNPISITGCVDSEVTETNLLTFDLNHTDLDSDSGTYATNATEGSLDPSTGIFTWTPGATDSGVYVWNFNVTDGYGSTNDCDITITVNDYETIPDISMTYPDTPVITQFNASDINMGATIDQSSNNHWEIDNGTGYSHLEWDNSTLLPAWIFSPVTYGIGDYNVKLTTHNVTSDEHNSSYVWAIHVEGNWTTHDMVLVPYYSTTIIAKDATTYATISTFTATLQAVEKSTTTGTITFDNTSYGLYSLLVTASGHASSSSSVLVMESDTVTVYLTSTVADTTDPGAGTYYPPHYVQFIVTDVLGTLYSGVDVGVSWMNSEGTTSQKGGTTGMDGVVGFNMTQNIRYTLEFVNASQGINETFTLYPVDYEYVVIVSSSISFDPGTPDTNLTNTTIQYTNQTWSIQNLTGDYLSTTLGISHTGQGVIAATICWATASVACGAPTLVVLGILAHLGIISWVMVLFTGMTMLSIYILGGKIG